MRLNNWDEKMGECAERVFKLFTYDTQTLLDCVLADSVDDPQFSANTAYNRLSDLVIIENSFFGRNVSTVEDYLRSLGYDEQDIALLEQKRADEDRRMSLLKKPGEADPS